MSGKLYIKELGIKDFSGNSFHNYTVYLEPNEIQEIIRTLALTAKRHPENVLKIVNSELKSLLQLSALAAGIELKRSTPPECK